MTQIPFGLQLYSIRDHLDNEPWKALQRVKEIGYDHVELAGYAGQKATEFQAMVSDAGLKAVAAHVGFEDATGNIGRTIEEAQLFGYEYMVVGIRAQTREEWLDAARALDAAGQAYREAGLQLCYHNHDHEFKVIDGRTALDTLFAAIGAGRCLAEIDTYWVRFAGHDPVAVIAQYAGRCPLLHIKDMTATEPRTYAPVGDGVMQWDLIFDAARKAGVKWLIVEQDEAEGDTLEAVARSAVYMKHA